MTEEDYYDWQTLDGGNDVLGIAAWHGDKVSWSIKPDGDRGILLRAKPLDVSLREKIRSHGDPSRLQSKRLKDLADIARLVESHPELWASLTPELQSQIDRPE